MILSGELDYRIRYDVEHDLFHAQNVYSDDYITPTFVEYVRQLEAQIEKMKCGQNCKHSYLYQEDRKCKFTYCDCINCKDKWELRR